MDLNLVILCGRLSAPPDHRQFESGSSCLHLLVTVRSERPTRRIDVVPVTWWDPDPHSVVGLVPGARLWIAGSAQRRFRDGSDGRRSTLEVIARAVNVLGEDRAILPV